MEEIRYSDELQHYGVRGMKWGVRRGTKQLSKATTIEARDKAIKKLETHRSKATNKVNKLAAKNEKLTVKSDKYAIKNDVKAAKLQRKAAKLNRKAYTGLRTQGRRAKLKWKAEKVSAKAEFLVAKSNSVKAKIAKNETLSKKFNEGINTIDRALVDQGRRFINDN